jgi:Ca2+-binding EF-hand superfamily protein
MRVCPFLAAWLPLLAVAWPQLALPQDAPRTPAGYLARMDRDHDGRVSQAEYVDYLSAGFRRLDRNADGVLEPQELPGGHGRAVTLAQWQTTLRRQFGKLDSDHNGYLDARELTQPPQP